MNLFQGDCLEILKTLEASSVDSLVTDPPAGISFMGKEWDGDKGGRTEWIRWMTSVMGECLRVLKPGAHGLIWALPRTSHWTATALEDAGFEVRDVVTHLFGTGFPKSMNLEKAGAGSAWAGWGTALKPASEHWILVRKPCSEKTVAANVLKFGTGGINIDASRVGTEKVQTHFYKGEDAMGAMKGNGVTKATEYAAPKVGRFPANLILDEEAAAALDEQSGISCHTGTNTGGLGKNGIYGKSAGLDKSTIGYGDRGGASRFFYVAKASKADKNNGLDLSGEGKAVGARPNSGYMTGKFPDHDQRPRVGNFHPTVKSTALMTYLIKLVTPPGGVVLDPFMGSGSTGVSAKQNGFAFIGIERDESYHAIAKARNEVTA